MPNIKLPISSFIDWWKRAKYADEIFGTDTTKHPLGLILAEAKYKIDIALGNHPSQALENPMMKLHEERKKQCDENGRVKLGTNLANMSAKEIQRENETVQYLASFYQPEEYTRAVDVIAKASEAENFEELKRFYEEQFYDTQHCGIIQPNAPASDVTSSSLEVNEEHQNINRNTRNTAENYSRKIYAGESISRSDLAMYDENGRTILFNHALDSVFIDIFSKSRDDFASDRHHFSIKPDGLYDRTGRTAYITSIHTNTKDADSRRTQDLTTYDVSDRFYEFLLRMDNWNHLANGVIEQGIIESQS